MKGKILISILTGAITLTTAGMATIITNPSASSTWLSPRFPAFNRQNSAENVESHQDEWFETTVPDEASLLAVPPAPTTDTSASASVTSVTDEEDGDEAEEAKTGEDSLGKTDVVASASTPASESGSSGSSGSAGSTTSVDVVASASKPGSTTPVSMDGLISLEEAIKFARSRVGAATYKGFELDDDYPPVYELYFVSGNTGYEVEILAANGEILDIDSETAYMEEDDERDDDRDDDEHDDEEDEHDDEEDEEVEDEDDD